MTKAFLLTSQIPTTTSRARRDYGPLQQAALYKGAWAKAVNKSARVLFIGGCFVGELQKPVWVSIRITGSVNLCAPPPTGLPSSRHQLQHKEPVN